MVMMIWRKLRVEKLLIVGCGDKDVETFCKYSFEFISAKIVCGIKGAGLRVIDVMVGLKA